MRSTVPALCLAALLVVAGCSAPSGPSTTAVDDATATTSETTARPTDTSSTPTATATSTPTTAPTTTTTDDEDDAERAPADPAQDVEGWENGYWYNESISIDQSDGLNRSELEAVKSRMMARIEVIRDAEFDGEISVEIISREEYRNRRSGGGGRTSPWLEQYYEAAFIINESETYGDAIAELYASSVAGYYSPRSDSIVVISDDPDSLELSRSTLVHELEHGLQDQALPRRSSYPRTYDELRAHTAVTEGDANYVMDTYERKCGEEWSCIEPAPEGDGGDRDINMGLFAIVWLPYSEGPTFVKHLREEGGWEAVNEAMRDRPDSTEQIIHPEKYPNDTPTDVTVEDRTGGDWGRVGRSGTIGEAALYAMFWKNGVIPREHIYSDDRRWNYSHPLTAGWEGDAIVPYTNGTSYGYVFKSTWETERDARQFYRGYLELLESKGAVEVREGVYRIPDGGYADAFRVVRHGDTVIVVNAPTVAALDDVHAPANASASVGPVVPAIGGDIGAVDLVPTGPDADHRPLAVPRGT